MHSLINEMNQSKNIFGKGVMGANPEKVDNFLQQLIKMSSMIDTSLGWDQANTDEWQKRKDEEYLRKHQEMPLEFPLSPRLKQKFK